MLGIATHAVITTFCDRDPDAVRDLRVRFTAPAYPGETIRTELWRDGNVVSFRAFADEREVMVLSNGCAKIG
jgi:acyl dehydratase